jgi:membrane fusion protein (multidrug efflux system)
VGSYISPQTKIVTLQNINPIKVDFSVPQKYFPLLKEGKQIIVNLASTKKSYKGTIYALEPKIDLNTRTVQVRSLIPNTNRELTPGAYVEIYIILEDIKDAIMVPTDVLIPDLEGEYVFVNKNNIAITRKVETGIRTENEIQIVNGLNMGDTLIVSGIIQLRPNTPIKMNVIN